MDIVLLGSASLCQQFPSSEDSGACVIVSTAWKQGHSQTASLGNLCLNLIKDESYSSKVCQSKNKMQAEESCKVFSKIAMLQKVLET